jgi:hypothetical protein
MRTVLLGKAWPQTDPPGRLRAKTARNTPGVTQRREELTFGMVIFLFKGLKGYNNMIK